MFGGLQCYKWVVIYYDDNIPSTRWLFLIFLDIFIYNMEKITFTISNWSKSH